MTITAPLNGARVQGTVTVTVSAPGVQRVQFYIDGTKKTVDTASPFVWTWDTTAVQNGSHTIKAVSGNGKQSASVMVTVANPITVNVTGVTKVGQTLTATVSW